MKEDKSKDKKIAIMDVSKPGSTKPSPTSKNIIIKSTPVINDPMVLSDADEDGTEQIKGAPPLEKTLRKSLTINPLHPDLKPEEAENKDQEELEEPLEDHTKPLEKVDSDIQPEEENKDQEKDQEEQTKPSGDNLISRKQVVDNSSTKQDQLKDDQEEKHDREITELINSKEYFLPINQRIKKHNKIIYLVGLIMVIVLIIIWFVLALRYGLIH